MNQPYERPAAADDFDNAPSRTNENPVANRPAALLAIFVAASIALSAWFVVSAGTANVSAAASETTTPHIPYFPSQYTNQASEPSPVPATF